MLVGDNFFIYCMIIMSIIDITCLHFHNAETQSLCRYICYSHKTPTGQGYILLCRSNQMAKCEIKYKKMDCAIILIIQMKTRK